MNSEEPTPAPCPESMNNVNIFIPVKQIIPPFQGPYIRIQYAIADDARHVRGVLETSVRDYFVYPKGGKPSRKIIVG